MTSKDLPESKVPVLPPIILLGPGPSMVHPRVLQSMMSGMIGYLDTDFLEVFFYIHLQDSSTLFY